MTHQTRPQGIQRFALHLLLAFLLLAPPGVPASFAAPRGEQVENGQAEFLRDGTLTVIRASDGAIINYESFDILSNEAVEFIQPDSTSRVLNRVQSFDPTHIDGSLRANGIVYIVNPVGIFIGTEAIVDVGGLVAASGHLSDSDFISGVDHFSELAGSVENHGTIRAGHAALIGRVVANHGSILARDGGEGLIALVAGGDVVLTRRDGHVVVHVDAPATDPGSAGIEQTGTLDARGGGVVLTTGDLYSLAINHEGITRGGDIQIAGGEGGLVRVSGTLDASNAAFETGGSVEVTGDRVALVGADVDASGGAGGGRIRIGGGPRGERDGARDVEHGVATANRTVVDAATSLRADATLLGDGGEVIVWADEAAAFHGQISARGGPRGGDGGFAEVSAPILQAPGSVDLGAPRGESGTLLYDPQDIEIVGGSADGTDSPDPNADNLETDGGSLGEVLFGDLGDGANPFLIYESEIEATDANIVLEAENSITVSGTFNNDADGVGADDPGVNVVLIQNGNSLTLQTRNEPGDDTGSSENPGIDLTDGGALAGLEWKTLGGGITIRTGDDGNGAGGGGSAADVIAGTLTTQGGNVALSTTDGAISVDRIDTSAIADSGGNGGSIAVTSGGSHDVTLGDLVTAGADGAAVGPARGLGGGVNVDAEDGAIEIAGIDSSGGSGEDNGGSAGTIRIRSLGVGGVTVLGDIDATGGDRTLPDPQNANGGNGGGVTITTVEGAIEVQGIDASGGDGEFRSGGGRAIFLAAGGNVDDGEAPGNITFNGMLRSEDGAGPIAPFVPNAQVTVVATEAIEGPDLAVDISGDVSVSLRGKSIGASDPIVVRGGTSEDGLVQVIADGDARVSIDTPTVDEVRVQQEAVDSTIVIDRADGSGDLVHAIGDAAGQGGLGTSTIAEIDTTDAGLALNFILNATDADLLVPSDSTVFGGAGILQSGGDIVLETGAGAAIEMVAGAGGEAVALTLNADSDGDGQGGIDHDGGPGPHILSNGDVTLRGITIGAGSPGEPLVIEGGGDATGLLATTGSGDIHVDVVTNLAFGSIVVTQRAVAGDVTIDQVGGDEVRIVGTAASGNDPGFTTLTRVDTQANGTGFGFSLTQETPDLDPDDGIASDDPDVFLTTGQINIGGNGVISSTGDLVVGDTAGTAISVGGEAVALEADRNLNRNGGLFNGAPGVEIELTHEAPQLLLFGGTGVGSSDDPIVVDGVAQIGVDVLDEGGIFVHTRRDGDLAIAETGPPQLGGAIQSVPGLRVFEGPGDIEIVHTGGDISLEGSIRTFDDEADFSILAESDAATIYFDADPLRFSILASTGGSQTWGNPVVIRQDARLIGNDITFAGSIDSETDPVIDPDFDPVDDPSNQRSLPTSLEITTGGIVSFGGSIGANGPLTSLRIEDQAPIFDPETGLITPPEGDILIDGAIVATTGRQFFGNSVTLAQDTLFSATPDAEGFEGNAVTFLIDLDGPGAANVEAGAGDVVFGGNVGTTTLLGGLSVDFTGTDPGTITFIGTETVATGDGGITLSPAGRDEVPAVATIFKTGVEALLNPPDTGFPDAPKPASSVGPLTFTTTGDVVIGRNEKISVADKLSVQANHFEAGDLSAFKIDIDTATYTILGREPGNVILAGGGEQMDAGVDIVANRVTLAAPPIWDGVGTAPTFFTQTGGVDAAGGLEGFTLRMIDESGGKVTLEDFTRPNGTVLDLTGNGPLGVGNPATQNVQEGDRVALLIPPRSSRTETDATSTASAEDVLATLECGDLGSGAPSGCPGAVEPSDRVLTSTRARETATAYRAVLDDDTGPARNALRDAMVGRGVWTASGAIDGAALRRRVETAPRRDPAVAYLDRRNAILTELRLLNLSEATSVEVERTLVSRWADELALPGLDATALGKALGSARNGLVL